MSSGIIAQLPDLASLVTERDTAGDEVTTVLEKLSALGEGGPSSPLAGVGGVLTDLGDTLDIDVSGLSTRLPEALDIVRNALPPDSLAFIESIEDAYATVSDFLSESALVQAVGSGGSLQDVALAVIEDALQLFSSRIDDLAGNLIDPELLQQVRNALAAIDSFRSDFPAHQSEFLPFIAQHLIGVSANLLEAPRAHLETSLTLAAALEPAALTAALAAPRQALTTVFEDLIGAIEGLDAADAAGYTQIAAGLQAAEDALGAVLDALNGLYGLVGAQTSNPAWDAIFPTLRTLLEAVPLERVLSVDDIIDLLAGLLDELLARLYMTFGVDDLRARLEAMSQAFRDTFAGSALGQVRQTLIDFLEQIREAIESVPTEAIQAAVEDMLGRVREELEALGITQIQEQIAQAFEDVDTFVTTHINDTLQDEVRGALEGLAGQVEGLNLAGLIQQLTGAIAQIEGLIEGLGQELQAQMDNLRTFLSQLDELSFQPISDQVIAEIEDVTERLRAIQPNALSDVERVAIQAALAVLEVIDLEEQVVAGLKSGFQTGQSGLKSLLDDITAAIQRLTEILDAYSPQALLGALEAPLQQAGGLVDRVRGRLLLAPLYEQVDQFAGRLAALSPGALLDPLQAPYQEMRAAVDRLNLDRLVVPLRDLYTGIDRLIDFIDVTPVLEELDRRQRALFESIQQAILTAFDSVSLPEPLDSFFNDLRPVFEGLTAAIFDDPGTELPQIGGDLGGRLRVTSLFEPLDRAFDDLVDLIETVPQEALTDTFNVIRETVGLGLDRLDPRAIIEEFRAAEGRLAGLAPTALLGLPLTLPRLKLIFTARVATAPPERQGDVASISARFDAVAGLVIADDPDGRFNLLSRQHGELVDSLRRRINALDLDGVAEAYRRLHDNLDRLLPDFLRRTEPLTIADILAGIENLRPSTKAAKIDLTLERFLARIRPLQEALGPVIDGFFGAVRDVMMLLNPLSLREAVEEIYDALRDKVRVIDPDALAEALRRDVFEPLLEPLAAIDPAEIKRQINEVFSRALTALTTRVKGFLDDLTGVIDTVIGPVREAIQALLQQLGSAVTTLGDRLQSVLDDVEQLVLVEILDRLKRLVDNLGLSFNRELDRVQNAFDSMLAAIPLGQSGQQSAAVGIS